MVEKCDEFVIVPRWLILGAFPGSAQENPTLKDGIAGEAELAPSLGHLTEGRIWQQSSAYPVDLLESSFGFEYNTWCYAYAFSYVYLPESEVMEIRCGSDDGIAVWVNGELVHYNDTARGVELDNDIIPVKFRKGWNRLLLKISQGGGTWGFTLRLRRTEPTGALRFALQRSKGARHGGATMSLQTRDSRFSALSNEEGLQLQWRVELFNETVLIGDEVTLGVESADGTVLLAEKQASIIGLSVNNLVLKLPADTIFPAMAAGAELLLTARSTLGEVVSPIPAVLSVSMLLGAMQGFLLHDIPGSFLIPRVFRGQPALLQVRSQRELSAAGQTLARKPRVASRSFTAAETATKLLIFDLEVPSDISDPVITLEFGGDAERLLLRQLRLFVEDLALDTSAAIIPARAGLLALANGDVHAAWESLQEVLDRLVETLPDYSQQQITLVGHAHIDMNWMWTSVETEQITHDTFRQVLAFMEEFPQFTFSQSQSAAYQMIENNDPAMFAAIKERVAEGRWEILGGMVDEGDTNLASGEGIARSLLLGQRYFRDKFGKIATVGWLPDNFGHAAQLPQLLRQAGISGFFGHRCMPLSAPFLWQAPDGSEVISYAVPSYNGQVLPDIRELVAKSNPEQGKSYLVYGVGDHGGGPTRRDIVNGLFYQTVPRFPKVNFGAAGKFFSSLQSSMHNYPVIKGELQYIFTGCYTSIAQIKELNRRCENSLFAAELLSALLCCIGFPYPKDELRKAWQIVAFNQFHDILCGSGNGPSNREAIGAYDHALLQAERARDNALRALSASLPTAENNGQPVVVFNPLPFARSEAVEADIFCYDMPPSVSINQWSESGPPTSEDSSQFMVRDMGQGMFPTIRLTDANGVALDAQIVGARHFPQGFRLKVSFIAEQVPPCGWQLYYADTTRVTQPLGNLLQVQGTTINTAGLCVAVDKKSGQVTRVFDKRRGISVLPRGKATGVLKLYFERPHDMSAWRIGDISTIVELDKPEQVKVVEQGPVRAVIESCYRYGDSIFKQRVIVYAGLARVEFETEVHWFERGDPQKDAAMLRVSFPQRGRQGKFTCETPYAALNRPTDGQEVPAQRWVDYSSDVAGVTLVNDGKYGFNCTGNVLEMALLRASYSPDPYPDQGKHIIRYALHPHDGDWCAGRAIAAGQSFNIPLLAHEVPSGKDGLLPVRGSLLQISPENCQLSAVKQAEDGKELIVRCCEMHGSDSQLIITFSQAVLTAERVTLLEETDGAGSKPIIAGKEISMFIRGHEVVSVKVTFV